LYDGGGGGWVLALCTVQCDFGRENAICRLTPPCRNLRLQGQIGSKNKIPGKGHIWPEKVTLFFCLLSASKAILNIWLRYKGILQEVVSVFFEAEVSQESGV
jgi:hypothetical protein